MESRKSVAAWVSREREETLGALRHDIFKREREAMPDTIGGIAKVKAVYENKPVKPDSIPAMPKGKVRSILKAVPDNVRLRSADDKCARWTKDDAKVSPYVWRDLGNGPELIRRDRLEYDPALFGLEPIQPAPMVKRKPRTDGKKVFADYRKGVKPFMVERKK